MDQPVPLSRLRRHTPGVVPVQRLNASENERRSENPSRSPTVSMSSPPSPSQRVASV